MKFNGIKKFIYLVIIVFSYNLSAMETTEHEPAKSSFFGVLPIEIYYPIINQIVQRSKDIEEATKSIRALPVTDTVFNKLINDPGMTQFILTALSNKFTQNLVEAALHLRTSGADAFLSHNEVFEKNKGEYWRQFSGLQNLPIMKYLAGKDKALINAEDEKNGRTALHRAMRWGGNVAIVKWLLDNGADVNKIDKEGYSPLVYLFWSEDKPNSDVVKILIDHGADINKKYGGQSVLFWAVWRGDEKIVQLLLEHGARDPEAHQAATTPEMISLLEKYGIK